VIRPADANETAQAWQLAVDRDGPTALLLTRHGVPVLDGTADNGGVARGGYVLVEADGAADIVLIGTGSEVHVCVEAARVLAGDGVAARVVSLPSWDLFEEQDASYRRAVLPPGVPRLAVEAASPFGWERYADATVTVDRFGASAPGQVVLDNYGFTPANVATRAHALLAERGRST
jgi:transketolase